ncbi:MAG: hypothetical protein M1544_01860 [Candidatus Marsarchaeota archaeon]|nr:hypothetical protein [Candidatus Marsarchaeota archaeon]MCL5102080.1 hypothetical protein [Candidatus Marsarchaeota archaeon]
MEKQSRAVANAEENEENVSVSINNRQYNTIMRTEDAKVYKATTDFIAKHEPIISKAFEKLLENYGKALAREKVPESVSKRLLNNQYSLYTDYLKPLFKLKVSRICSGARDDPKSDEVSGSIQELAGSICESISSASENIGKAENFTKILDAAYAELKKSLAGKLEGNGIQTQQ